MFIFISKVTLFYLSFVACISMTQAQQIWSFPKTGYATLEHLPNNTDIVISEGKVFWRGNSCLVLDGLVQEMFYWLELGGSQQFQNKIPRCAMAESRNSMFKFEVNLTNIFNFDNKFSYEYLIKKLWERRESNFPKWPDLTVLKTNSGKIILKATNCEIAKLFSNDILTWSNMLGHITDEEPSCNPVENGIRFNVQIDLTEHISPKIASILNIADSEKMIVNGPNCFGTVQYLMGVNSNLTFGGAQEMGLLLKTNSCHIVKRNQKMQTGDIILFSLKPQSNTNSFKNAIETELYKTPEHAAIFVGSDTIFEKQSIQGFDHPEFITIENSLRDYEISNDCQNIDEIHNNKEMNELTCNSFTQVYRCDLSNLQSELISTFDENLNAAKTDLDQWMIDMSALLGISKQNCYSGSRKPLEDMEKRLSIIRDVFLTEMIRATPERILGNSSLSEFLKMSNRTNRAVFYQYMRVIAAYRTLGAMVACIEGHEAVISSAIQSEHLNNVDIWINKMLWPSSASSEKHNSTFEVK